MEFKKDVNNSNWTDGSKNKKNLSNMHYVSTLMHNNKLYIHIVQQ